MRVLLAFFLTVNSCIVFSQKKITDTTALRLINEIADHNVHESALIGADGDSSLQFKKYLLLSSLLNEEQFYYLALRNKNGVVRSYAYLYFFEKEPPDRKRLIKKIKHDRTKIKTLMGCLGRTHRICTFFSY